MFECDRIDISEGTNANKANGSYECFVYHDWYFLEIKRKFQPKVCMSWFNAKNYEFECYNSFC